MIRSHRLLRRLAGAGVAFALLAAMTVGLAGPAAAATRFNDVPRSQPFYGDITWLVRHGIADGYKDGGYHPDRHGEPAGDGRLPVRVPESLDHTGSVHQGAVLRRPEGLAVLPADHAGCRTRESRRVTPTAGSTRTAR